MTKVYEKALEFKKNFPGGVVWRLKRHSEVVDGYINPDEEVIFAFGAQKNISFNDLFTSCVVVLTSKRLLIGQKRVMWGSKFSSITPDLYNDMQIYQGLMWGKITIDTVKEKLVLSNLPKKGLDVIETHVSEFMMAEKKKYGKREESE